MAWRWRYLGGAGAVVAGPGEEFEDQQQAESWFGDVWPELLAAGVEAVELFDGDERVYGPMSLHEG